MPLPAAMHLISVWARRAARSRATSAVPITGSQQIGEGAAELTRQGGANKAEGAAKIVGGALDVSSLALPAAALRSPVRLAAGLLLGGYTREEVEQALTGYGVDPRYAKLGGQLAGVLAGARAAKLPDDGPV